MFLLGVLAYCFQRPSRSGPAFKDVAGQTDRHTHISVWNTQLACQTTRPKYRRKGIIYIIVPCVIIILFIRSLKALLTKYWIIYSPFFCSAAFDERKLYIVFSNSIDTQTESAGVCISWSTSVVRFSACTRRKACREELLRAGGGRRKLVFGEVCPPWDWTIKAFVHLCLYHVKLSIHLSALYVVGVCWSDTPYQSSQVTFI